MCAACLCLSAPLSTDPHSGIYKARGADPQPNYVGGAQLDCSPIHLPHSTHARTKEGKLFIFLSGTQITWGDRVEVFAQAAGLELDIRAVVETFSQDATAVLHGCQQTMLQEGLLEPNSWPHEHGFIFSKCTVPRMNTSASTVSASAPKQHGKWSAFI